MKISLVILTKNEIKGVSKVVPTIPKNVADEIIAVDYKSTDGTKEFFEKSGIRVITQEKPGRGEAFRLALEKTSGDAIIFFSPDGNEDTKDIEKFKSFLEKGNDLVIASRMMKGAHNEEDGQIFRLRKWVNQSFTLAANMLWNRSGVYITDTINGFRAITRKAFSRLNLDGQGYTIEYQMSIQAFKNRMKIVEFPTFEDQRIGGGGAPAFSTGVKFVQLFLKEIAKSFRIIK